MSKAKKLKTSDVLLSTNRYLEIINNLEINDKLRLVINEFIKLHILDYNIYPKEQYLYVGNMSAVRFRGNLSYIIDNINKVGLIDEIQYFVDCKGIKE